MCAGLQGACQQYRALMARLVGQPYAVALTAFWAVEWSYNQAWSSILGSVPPEYQEFADRWA